MNAEAPTIESSVHIRLGRYAASELYEVRHLGLATGANDAAAASRLGFWDEGDFLLSTKLLVATTRTSCEAATPFLAPGASPGYAMV